MWGFDAFHYDLIIYEVISYVWQHKTFEDETLGETITDIFHYFLSIYRQTI